MKKDPTVTRETLIEKLIKADQEAQLNDNR